MSHYTAAKASGSRWQKRCCSENRLSALATLEMLTSWTTQIVCSSIIDLSDSANRFRHTMRMHTGLSHPWITQPVLLGKCTNTAAWVSNLGPKQRSTLRLGWLFKFPVNAWWNGFTKSLQNGTVFVEREFLEWG